MPTVYGNHKVPYQIQGSLFSTEVYPSIPSVGSPGTFNLYWRPNTISAFLLIKKGDRITVRTGGINYDYFAAADAVLFDYAETTKLVSVTNNIQVVHALGDPWFVKTMPTSMRLGYSTITSCLPTGKLGSNDCLPYLIDWPDAVDANGIPFDQANLWGLSFRSLGDDLRPVPRVIGAEYTLMTPRTLGSFYVPSQRTTYEPPTAFHFSFPSYLRYRTATGAWDRGHESSYAARYQWQARPVNVFAYAANNNPYSGGSVLAWNTGTGEISGGLAGAVPYSTGVRGGQYSICGQCVDPAGTYTGFTVDVILDDAGGAGQVVLQSIVIPAAPGLGPWTVVTGTWSGVVLPTAPGVCKRIYLKCTPGIPGATYVSIFSNSGISISGATNVPWCHSVATGSKVAPGGLIAPFYEPY